MSENPVKGIGKSTDKTYRCGHCNLAARMVVAARGSEHKRTDFVGELSVAFKTRVLLECPGCNQLNVFLLTANYRVPDFERDFFQHDDITDEWEFGEVERLYPPMRLGEGSVLPERVRRIFEEATKLRVLSPTASILFARKTLEAICTDKGVKAGNLQKSVQKLIGLDLFPKIMDETILDRIRVLGNDAAHELDWEATTDEAVLMLDLVAAVVGYAYEAPALVERVRQHVTQTAGSQSAPPVPTGSATPP